VVPWLPAADVLVSRVPAGGTQPGQGPVLAPPSGSPSPLVAESGVPSAVSPLPADLAANPVLGRWLDFSRDGEVMIRAGKMEYGQGIWTALAQVAAEELQVRMARVRVAPVSTGTSPDEGVTAGSLSVQDSGSALRQVCAQARDLLLAAAATRLGVARTAGRHRTKNGDIFVRAVDYIHDPQIDPSAARAILDQNASALLGVG
jgi:hypothetical protein